MANQQNGLRGRGSWRLRVLDITNMNNFKIISIFVTNVNRMNLTVRLSLIVPVQQLQLFYHSDLHGTAKLPGPM